MRPIETTHRDYTIRYSENEDVWRSYDLALEHQSLAKLKEMIDKFLLKLRKDAAIERAQALDQKARAAHKEAQQAWRDVPKIEQSDVADLIRAATEKTTE